MPLAFPCVIRELRKCETNRLVDGLAVQGKGDCGKSSCTNSAGDRKLGLPLNGKYGITKHEMRSS